ncbi:MAG: sigma-54-dependent Fis family transcriptional regulator [Ignavibacteria bacterium]|nr:sigma-54-dependent Fis family transcriptional regulator [Ignavibacteria bacterium]
MLKYNLLLVEDEAAQREVLSEHLSSDTYSVFSAESAEQALNIFQSKVIDLVITDFNLPEKNGQYLMEKILSINPFTPIILITAYAKVDNAVMAMKKGAFDYITKPINIDELQLVIKRALEHKTLKSENLHLRESLQSEHSLKGIISASKKMEEILNLAGRVAESKASILIRGESGTGKEVLAKAIHFSSRRSEKPFIAFNAAALSPTLIESELFGHEKGAFTGADRQRIGRFEQSNGGTIFIDEIGDIPLELQSKFLRVLQENNIERIGGNETIEVDIRVIAATHKNLEQMILDGKFRQDLFYRLNVITIDIPPLRDRKEDILPLTNHFIKKYSSINNKNVDNISKEAFSHLMKYDFPGNVRELENIIERAITLSRSNQIVSDDFPQNIFQSDSKTQKIVGSMEEQVESLEKNMISIELKKCGGNQSKVAKNLGITERKLRYKIKKYGLI